MKNELFLGLSLHSGNIKYVFVNLIVLDISTIILTASSEYTTGACTGTSGLPPWPSAYNPARLL